MMHRWHAAALAGLFLAAFGRIGSAQEITPVACPIVEDSRGVAVGPIIGMGLSEYGGTNDGRTDLTVPMVSLAVDGEVFVLGVMKDLLVGTMPLDVPLHHAASDCSGQGYTNYTPSPGGHPFYGSGPAPLTVVTGPQMTLWASDPGVARVPLAAGSVMFWHGDDPHAPVCAPLVPPRAMDVYPLRRVVDLATAFTPPFRIVNARCPRPNGGP